MHLCKNFHQQTQKKKSENHLLSHFLVSYVSFLKSPFPCLTSPVSRLKYSVSCLTSPVSRLLSHSYIHIVSVSPFSRVLSLSRLWSHNFCLLPHIYCIKSPASLSSPACLLSTVSHVSGLSLISGLSLVSCLSYVSYSTFFMSPVCLMRSFCLCLMYVSHLLSV